MTSQKPFMNTKEVAAYLGIHEKNVYGLLSKRGLPGTKITGKWIFPKDHVDAWLEENLVNRAGGRKGRQWPLVVSGSDDPLLRRAVFHFRENADCSIVYAPQGSLGGLDGLREGWCSVAGCHIYDGTTDTYNKTAARLALGEEGELVEFCRREQGLAVLSGNPKRIRDVGDLLREDVIAAQRREGTGTRSLQDYELRRLGRGSGGLDNALELDSHMDVAMAVRSGHIDTGLCVRTAAEALELDFIPVKMEEFHLILRKAAFKDDNISRCVAFFQSHAVREMADQLGGYEGVGIG